MTVVILSPGAAAGKAQTPCPQDEQAWLGMTGWKTPDQS